MPRARDRDFMMRSVAEQERNRRHNQSSLYESGRLCYLSGPESKIAIAFISLQEVIHARQPVMSGHSSRRQQQRMGQRRKNRKCDGRVVMSKAVDYYGGKKAPTLSSFLENVNSGCG